MNDQGRKNKKPAGKISLISEYAALEFAESIINTVHEPLIALDHDLRIVKVSRSFYEFFKVTPEETVGQLIYDLGNKQWDIPKLRELLETILSQKATFENYEVEHDFATIGRRTMLLNARQIHRVLGKERIILLAIEDITERKMSFRAALKAAKAGTWEWDLKTNDNIWSDEIWRLYDLDPHTHKPSFDSWLQSIFPEARTAVTEDLFAAVSSGSTIDIEWRVNRADGSTCWLMLRGQPQCDENGRAVKYLGTVIDITEFKQIEQNYQSLFHEMMDGFALHEILLDKNGVPVDYRFLAINPAFERMTGLNAADIVGRTVLEVLPRTEQHWIETYGKVALTGKPAFFENYSAELKKHFKVTVYRPNPNQFACIFTDITERKSLESKLLQAHKMEAVGQLAGGVAHDFNNMLSIIIGYADIALMKIDPADKLATEIKKILVAGQKAADLTKQLLAFARKQIIAPKFLNLNETVGNMSKLLERLIGDNIELIWKPSADLTPVRMDPSQIDQILANLVVNARDAIQDAGKIIIETETAEFDEAYCAIHSGFVPGRYVLLAVSDNGSGMDMETQARIFEPFFTTKEIGKGTGLGLATLFGIVKQNHGFIDINSEPGKGSTFKIYIPIRESEQEAVIYPVHAEAPLGNETVLIVEDEKALLELIIIMFEELGYTVLAANSPIRAIQMSDEFTADIHLLLTDVMMPEMSGPELWQKLSSMRPEMKCMYMSGYTGKFISEHGILEDGIHFIPKPFSKEVLAARIREALER